MTRETSQKRRNRAVSPAAGVILVFLIWLSLVTVITVVVIAG